MSKTGFLLAEDEAIKVRLTGITVSDDRNATRPVKVFFRYPEAETERDYPFITIEMLDIVHAKNRQHSENELYYYNTAGGASAPIGASVMPNALNYWPSISSNFSNFTDKNDYQVLMTNEFVPVDLLYQVSTFTRSALHDRYLSSIMLTKIFPFRRGSIHVPADNTDRRLELLDWSTADLLDPEAGYRKRIFRKVYTLQMSAELPSTDVYGSKQATEIVATIDYTNS
jgi:hypothetical protein